MNQLRRTSIVAIGLALLTATTLHAQQPLPAGGDATIEMDVATEAHEWLEVMLLENYREHGHRDPAWDDDAEQLLRDYARVLTPTPSSHWQRPDDADVRDAARDLLDAGCNDPLVHHALGHMQYRLDDGGAAGRLDQAVDHYDDRDHHVVLEAIAAGYHALASGNADRPTERALELAIEAFTADVPAEHQQALHRVLFVNVFDEMPHQRLVRLNELLSVVERQVDPWQYGVIRGNIHFDIGFEYRSNEFARNVTPEQWRRFHGEMEIARDYLVAAHEREPERPEPASQMVRVANAWRGTQKSAREWFDATVAAQLDHLPAYRGIRNHLLPRWGGSHDAMIRFARDCVDTGRYDTEVPYQAYRIYQSFVYDFGHSHAPVAQFDALYDILDEMFAGYQENRPDSFAFNQGRRIALAWRFGKYDRGYELWQAFEGEELPDGSLDPFGGTPDRIRGEIVALGGPASEALEQARQARDDGEYEEAVDLLTDLVEQHAEPAELADYLDQELKAAELHRDFHAGRTIRLPRAPNAGWTVHAGDWSQDDQGDLHAVSRGRKLLVHDLKLPRRFEFTGQAEFTHGSSHEGFINGPALYQENRRPLLMLSDMAGKFTRAYQRTDLAEADAPADRVYRFRLMVFDNRLVYEVNGQRIFDSQSLLGGLPDDTLQPAVGAWYGHPSLGVVFRDLQLRRLDDPPADPPDYAEVQDEPLLDYDFTQATPDEAARSLPNRGLHPMPLVLRDGAQLDAFEGTPTFQTQGDGAYGESFFNEPLERWTVSAWVRGDEAPGDEHITGVVRFYPFAMIWGHWHEPARAGVELHVSDQWHHAAFGELKGERWYHLVGTYDGQELRAYRDGELVTAKDDVSGRLEPPRHSLRVGRHPEHASFEGRIARVRLYNRVLDEDEIRQLHEDRPADLEP